MTDLDRLDMLNKLGQELLIDFIVHVDAVGSDTGLAGMSPLERCELGERMFLVRVVEDDEGTVTA